MDDFAAGTLGSYIVPFLESKREGGLSSSSVSSYRSALVRLARWYRNDQLAAFQPPAGSDLLRNYVRADHRAPRTLARDLSIAGEFFKWCIIRGYLTGDPTTVVAIELPEADPSIEVRRVITEHDKQAILRASHDDQHRLVWRVLWTVGPRVTDLVRIQVRDYDPHDQSLTVRSTSGKSQRVHVPTAALQRDLAAWVEARMSRAGEKPTVSKWERARSEYLCYQYSNHARGITESGLKKRWGGTLHRAHLSNAYNMGDAQHTARIAVQDVVASEPASLVSLRSAIKDAPLAYSGYLEEAAGCYANHHYRATVLMVWNAVIEHLYNLVDPEMLDELEAVNKHRHRDGEARGYRKIKNMADLRHVPDKQFIEMVDGAGLIDRNIRTLLETHIKLRDYCAHPTGYQLTERQTAEFIEVLITNILGAHGMLHRHRADNGEPIPSERRTIPRAVRQEVFERDAGRCVDCGSREFLQYDHLLPLAQGGSNTADNIELRCAPCNQQKGGRI